MKMAEVANFPQMSTEQQQVYMRSLNRYRTVLATKDYDYNLGHEEGRVEGEKSKALTIAINLLAMGMSIEQVAQATGLAHDEVKSLKICQ